MSIEPSREDREALAQYLIGVYQGKGPSPELEQVAHVRLFFELQDVKRKLARAREALRRIAAVGYGIEINDTDKEARKYWSDLALRYRGIASETLRLLDEPDASTNELPTSPELVDGPNAAEIVKPEPELRKPSDGNRKPPPEPTRTEEFCSHQPKNECGFCDACCVCEEQSKEATLLDRVRELERQVQNEMGAKVSAILAVVFSVGGNVEGQPTNTLNYLQRIRELRQAEKDLATARERVKELEKHECVPTQWAYDAACAALKKAKEELATERASHEQTRQASLKWSHQWEAEKAAHEKTREQLQKISKAYADELEVHRERDDLERALADEKAAHEKTMASHVDDVNDMNRIINDLERQLADEKAAHEKWEEDARRYCQNADYWKAEHKKTKAELEYQTGHSDYWFKRADALERQLADAQAAREKAEAGAAAMREALEAAADWIEHPDHHEDECPGDCDGHASQWMVNKALRADAGSKLLAELTQERERREKAEAQAQEYLDAISDWERGDLERVMKEGAQESWAISALRERAKNAEQERDAIRREHDDLRTELARLKGGVQ